MLIKGKKMKIGGIIRSNLSGDYGVITEVNTQKKYVDVSWFIAPVPSVSYILHFVRKHFYVVI